MGSQHPVLAVAPQQELPPVFTRKAASPYFCFTTSLMSVVSVVLMMELLFTDLYDVLRFKSFVTGTTFGVEKLKQFLQSFRVCGVTEECSLPFNSHEVFGA